MKQPNETSITTTCYSTVTVEEQMIASDAITRYGIKHDVHDETILVTSFEDQLDSLDILMREELGQFDVVSV